MLLVLIKNMNCNPKNISHSPKVCSLKWSAALLCLLITLIAAPAHSQSALFVTKAKQAFLVDAETGTVLFAKDADSPVPPASLAKLMTAELVFNALATGSLDGDRTFLVSENAWRTGGAASGGSTMFAELKSEIPVMDLLRGMIVQSANDACIILAEGMSGSETNFAIQMTERARQLGLTQSRFGNSTGLPNPNSQVTMRDMVTLARHLYETYPEYYSIYSELDFEWNNIFQRNRNPLLRMEFGADGFKTGFTEASGYAIVGSAERDGRRVFLAMSGLDSAAERAAEARNMLEWGMGAFERRNLFKADEIIGNAAVFGGNISSVPLVAKAPIDVLLPLGNADRLTAQIRYNGPLPAPVEADRQVARLEIYLGDTLAQNVELYTTEQVEIGPLHIRALGVIKELALGWIR